MSSIHDYFLSVDNYNEPTSVSNEEAIYTLLVRLLILDPGTSDINPEMGVGIYSKWRYCDANNIPNLEAEITNQVLTYLPDLAGCTVSISLDLENPSLYIIETEISNILYTLKVDTSNKTINLTNITS